MSDSGCGSERYQQQMGFQVDPWDLDDCTECELCGGCATHFCYRNEKSSALHMDWFIAFASPGGPECGSIGRPPRLPHAEGKERPCQLTADHKGKHRSRMGWSWAAGRFPKTAPTPPAPEES
ncbi:hypothetical protein OG552_10760 [Streptomyces sp. NBC_01476]|uniref:hypothetical protein n=1 Tax=Streptomyces sp. NBC_01476 TaxID=2903881 RepID=UPI002E34BAA2|nr:hypothetical protein [Streptomyces sp. NBC_01476]